VLVLAALPAAAGTAVTVLSDSNAVYFNGAYTLGWEFSVASPVQVTSLGFWDYLGDGFHNAAGALTSVSVGIWNASQTLLIASSVASSGPISNVLPDGSGFRFDTEDTPFTLQPGTYYIGGTNHTESYLSYPSSSVTYDPAVHWISGQYAYGDTLTFPGTSDGATPAGWFGPNFTIGSGGVPEPGTGALFVGAGLWLAWLKRRRL